MKRTLAALSILTSGYLLLNFFSIPRESADVFLNYGFIGAIGALISGVLLLAKSAAGRWVALVWAVGSLIFFALDIHARVLRPYSASMFMGAYWAGKFDVNTDIGVATVYVFNTLKFALPLVTLATFRKLK